MNISYLIGTVSGVGDPADTPQFIVRYRRSDGSDRIEAYSSFAEATERWNRLDLLIRSRR